ncbi:MULTISPECIES: hypothetical protein [unclassified Meiothermus]|uniref:hypothetical protein n=1 Tax=unclassified Meiothermus TaxID=370471 RepID=UPI001F2374E2|nr:MULTISPECIES: hypothetical protein [unclassified Meiothermus]
MKSLLTYEALARLEPGDSFFFCPAAGCEVVYYSSRQAFTTDDLRVKVYPKDPSGEVPLCYCFGWTRAKLEEQIKSGFVHAVQDIRAHIQAKRCACELRNPQGACCLGNVEAYIRQRGEA